MKKERISLILVLGIVGVLVASIVIDSRASAVPVMEEVDVVDVMDKLKDDKLERLKIKETKSGRYAFKSLDDEIIKIGKKDSKPYAKLNKWDDETYISISFPTAAEKDLELENGKVKWKEDKLEVHIYPLEKKTYKEKDSKGKEHNITMNDDGGLEFEVILKEKPESNVFTFPMQTKGLKFYYQPELTQEEIDEGAFRPENVVGSYAVYHESKAGDYTKLGGKNYRTGKAFHIYRPRVYDANGNWIWGELNIDEKKGILTVIVDQNWLDNAVYPVVIDPNFGYTTAGGSSTGYVGNGVWEGTVFSLSGSGIANSITAYFSTNIDSDGDAAIYDDATPKAKVGSTTETLGMTAAAAWKTFDFSSGPSLSAQSYWLIFESERTGYYYWDSGTADQGFYEAAFNNYAYKEWPATIDDAKVAFHAKKKSIYLTYSAPANNAPTISSVTDSPDPVEDGNNITFSVDWNDADSEGIKMYVCKENDGGASGCGAGGTLCSNSNDYDLADPITCTYTTQSGVVGSKNFYVHVCDNEPSYSSISPGSVTVDPVLEEVTVWVDDETGYGVGGIEISDLDYTYHLVDEWWIGLDWESISDYDGLLAVTPSLIEDFETSYALYETVENVLAEEYFQDNIDWYPGYGPPDLPPYEPVVSFWFTGEALDKHIMYGHDQSGDVMFEGFVLGKQNDRPRCDFVMEVQDWVGIGIECVVDYLGTSLRAICWIGEED